MLLEFLARLRGLLEEAGPDPLPDEGLDVVEEGPCEVGGLSCVVPWSW